MLCQNKHLCCTTDTSMNAARALIEATLSKFVLPLRDVQCWILFSISLGNPYQVSIIRSMYATFSRNSCVDPIEHAACPFCHVGVAAFNDGPAHNCCWLQLWLHIWFRFREVSCQDGHTRQQEIRIAQAGGCFLIESQNS